FLECFAHRTGADRLRVLQETRGQCPETEARLDGALAQQHLIAPGRQAADDHLRILVMNGLAVRADEARHVVAFRHAEDECGGAAVTAEVHARAWPPRPLRAAATAFAMERSIPHYRRQRGSSSSPPPRAGHPKECP